MVETTVLDFLRHGEVQGGRYFRGVTDDPLTEQGWKQMHRQCAGRRWDAVLSSPLRRCHSFASAWRHEHNLPLLVDPDWTEIDFGAWEGQSAEQIEALYPEALQHFYADPAAYTPPKAEAYPDFTHRVKQALDRALAEFAGQTVLVVTHAGVIRALFSGILGVPPARAQHIDVPHACLSRFSCISDGNSKFLQLNFHKPE